MNASKLTDGVDIVDSENIGMTTNTVSPNEAGLKVVITDKLARQENESVFEMIGEQMGQAMGRIKEQDAINLFSGLNGGTALGLDGKSMTMNNLAAVIAKAKANKFGNDLVVIHHPNAVFEIVKDFLGATPQRLDANKFVEGVLDQFYRWTLNRVPIFETGLINKISGQDSGYGVIMDRRALAFLTSMDTDTRQQRDESLRATEFITVSDYLAFELDDSRGAALLFEIGDHSTST